jgi:hypothetical protein
MNKFINILLLLLTFPTMLVSIIIGFDLPIEFFRTTGAQLPYHKEVLIFFGLILLLIILRRSIKRWMGIRMVSHKKRFIWNQKMGKERNNRVYLYLSLEAAVMSFLCIVLYQVTPIAWVPSLAFGVGALDNLILIVLGRTKHVYRVGITSKALVLADRDVKIIYFSGLRRISIQQQTMFFEYIKDLQLSFPLDSIAEADKSQFKTILESQINRDKVFLSEAVKSL